MLEITKTLKEISKVLNFHEEWEQEYFDWKLYRNKDSIICDVLDSDETVLHKIEIQYDEDMDTQTILLDMIDTLYNNNINWMNKFINGTKAFNSRKIKSLANHKDKNNQDKVDKIVEDLIVRYKTDYKMKSDLYLYKRIVSDLYTVLDKSCPNWYCVRLTRFLIRKLNEFGYDDVNISCVLNTITIEYQGNETSILTTSKTRKDELLESVMNEIRGVK
ncbi:hypothetical protein [Clostridium beijerinckii]|uniref:Uncharacterized protein n=1 Tax=Clostridium beijerinckii TaxID=1520 RepID=A0AAE5H052_CLOBE|nr:hypothetical protein [Clostridium beijerinckii]NSB12104.1 hypothetical protein [Clostridium beijerinckii]OOM27438.1 hypothetical protein CLOBE_29960 [Clostridium beijerinckii]